MLGLSHFLVLKSIFNKQSVHKSSYICRATALRLRLRILPPPAPERLRKEDARDMYSSSAGISQRASSSRCGSKSMQNDVAVANASLQAV